VPLEGLGQMENDGDLIGNRIRDLLALSISVTFVCYSFGVWHEELQQYNIYKVVYIVLV
jgi:hypothetical protein